MQCHCICVDWNCIALPRIACASLCMKLYCHASSCLGWHQHCFELHLGLQCCGWHHFLVIMLWMVSHWTATVRYSLTWARGPMHVSPARARYKHHRAVHTSSAFDRDCTLPLVLSFSYHSDSYTTVIDLSFDVVLGLLWLAATNPQLD